MLSQVKPRNWVELDALGQVALVVGDYPFVRIVQ